MTEPQWPAVPSKGGPVSRGIRLRSRPIQGLDADPITPVLVGVAAWLGRVLVRGDEQAEHLPAGEGPGGGPDALELPKDLKNDRTPAVAWNSWRCMPPSSRRGPTGLSRRTAMRQPNRDPRPNRTQNSTPLRPGRPPWLRRPQKAPLAALPQRIWHRRRGRRRRGRRTTKASHCSRGHRGGRGSGRAPLLQASQKRPMASLLPSSAPPETPHSTLPWALEANQWEQANAQPDAEELKPYEEWPLDASTQVGGGELDFEAWGKQSLGTGRFRRSGGGSSRDLRRLGSGERTRSLRRLTTFETVPRPAPLLGGIVKTADDLMALPPEDRAEMVAFLQPCGVGRRPQAHRRPRPQAGHHRHPRAREHPGLAGRPARVSGGSRPGDPDVRPTGGG